MAKSAQNIPQIKPPSTDSLISVPPLSDILFRQDTISGIALPTQRLVEVQEDTVRTNPRIPVQTTIKNTTQKSRVELNQNDSIKFNLTDKTEASVDWEMNFDFQAQFNDSAHTLIDPLFLLSDSARKSQKISFLESPYYQKETSAETLKESTYNQKYVKDNGLIFNQNLMFGLLLFSVLLVGVVRVKYSKYLKDLFTTLLYPTVKNDELSGTNLSTSIPSYLLGFLFYFNSALFVYQISIIFGNSLLGFSGPIIIPLAFLFLFSIFSLKIIVFKISGTIFGTRKAVDRYLVQSANTSKIFAILILPFILFIPFSAEPIMIILHKMVFALFSFLYLIQLGRGIKNNYTSILSLYYIILYLCALEIVPLTLIFKVLFK